MCVCVCKYYSTDLETAEARGWFSGVIWWIYPRVGDMGEGVLMMMAFMKMRCVCVFLVTRILLYMCVVSMLIAYYECVCVCVRI